MKTCVYLAFGLDDTLIIEISFKILGVTMMKFPLEVAWITDECKLMPTVLCGTAACSFFSFFSFLSFFFLFFPSALPIEALGDSR